jgi:hypothetical protein
MIDPVQFALEIEGYSSAHLQRSSSTIFANNETRKNVRVLKLLKHELEINPHEMIPAIRKNVQQTKMQNKTQARTGNHQTWERFR